MKSRNKQKSSLFNEITSKLKLFKTHGNNYRIVPMKVAIKANKFDSLSLSKSRNNKKDLLAKIKSKFSSISSERSAQVLTQKDSTYVPPKGLHKFINSLDENIRSTSRKDFTVKVGSQRCSMRNTATMEYPDRSVVKKNRTSLMSTNMPMMFGKKTLTGEKVITTEVLDEKEEAIETNFTKAERQRFSQVVIRDFIFSERGFGTSKVTFFNNKQEF